MIHFKSVIVSTENYKHYSLLEAHFRSVMVSTEKYNYYLFLAQQFKLVNVCTENVLDWLDGWTDGLTNGWMVGHCNILFLGLIQC